MQRGPVMFYILQVRRLSIRIDRLFQNIVSWKKALKAPLVSNYSGFWYILRYKETPLLLALELEMLEEGSVFSN